MDQSEKIKEAWKKGKYSNRNEEYRKSEDYKQKTSKSVKQRWDEGIYSKDRNEKISQSHKGKLKPWLYKEKEIFYKVCKCGKKFITPFNKRIFCSKFCSANYTTKYIKGEVEKDRRKKISEKLKGKLPKNINMLHGSHHWNWKGGISCEPYCEIWLNNEYKNSIKERDKYSCLNPECSKLNNKLCIHHIDYNKKNCHPFNLITLCFSCNGKANKNREWHEYWYKAIIYQRYIKIKENGDV
jgi:hypothetical protein